MPAKKSASVAAAPPTHTLTRKEWGESKALQIELARVLDLPVVQMAFATLLRNAMPSASPVTSLVPGVSAEAMALADSNRYHHRSGMTHFYRALHALSRASDQKPRGQEWGTLLEEDSE